MGMGRHGNNTSHKRKSMNTDSKLKHFFFCYRFKHDSPADNRKNDETVMIHEIVHNYFQLQYLQPITK